VPPHDLLTAGFPCQPFSGAGRREGLGDPRGTLFLEIVRLARALRPRALLLENVRGLAQHDGGRTLATVLAELEAAGYRCSHAVLDAAALLPQARPTELMRTRTTLTTTRHTWCTRAARRGLIRRGQERARVFIVGLREDLPGAAAAFAWPRLPALRRAAADVLQASAARSDHTSSEAHSVVRWVMRPPPPLPHAAAAARLPAALRRPDLT
jgi:site-specific DNA-cytosine methylase